MRWEGLCIVIKAMVSEKGLSMQGLDGSEKSHMAGSSTPLRLTTSERGSWQGGGLSRCGERRNHVTTLWIPWIVENLFVRLGRMVSLLTVAGRVQRVNSVEVVCPTLQPYL